MARTTETKPKKGLRSLLLKLGAVCIAVYLVASFVGGQMKLAQKQRELQALETHLQNQVEENRELERLMESDDDAAYIERMAREKLGYARPHERIFVDLTGE